MEVHLMRSDEDGNQDGPFQHRMTNGDRAKSHELLRKGAQKVTPLRLFFE